jgi:hypothetical protein
VEDLARSEHAVDDELPWSSKFDVDELARNKGNTAPN